MELNVHSVAVKGLNTTSKTRHKENGPSDLESWQRSRKAFSHDINQIPDRSYLWGFEHFTLREPHVSGYYLISRSIHESKATHVSKTSLMHSFDMLIKQLVDNAVLNLTSYYCTSKFDQYCYSELEKFWENSTHKVLLKEYDRHLTSKCHTYYYRPPSEDALTVNIVH